MNRLTNKKEYKIDEYAVKFQEDLILGGKKYRYIVKACDNTDIKNIVDKLDYYISYYEDAITFRSVCKFVPASGAATRMFSNLSDYLNEDKDVNIDVFFDNIHKFPFYNKLKDLCDDKGIDLDDAAKKKQSSLIEVLLNDMQYSKLPKALMDFYTSQSTALTPIDIHIKEALIYTKNNNVSNIHITVSKEHENIVTQFCKKKLKSTKSNLNIDISVQKKRTDTICLDKNNEIVRDKKEVLLRPGGHGALISNLNQITSDVIFIKNIDNVSNNEYFDQEVKYKKAMAGYGLYLQNRMFRYLRKLDRELTSIEILEIINFIDTVLCIKLDNKMTVETFNRALVRNILDRPLRVCAMIKSNTDVHKGGRPFYVDHSTYSDLQIVEDIEIDHSVSIASEIASQSKYFNPSDMVCFTRDYKNKKFDLLNYMKQDAYFIYDKIINNKEVKVLEHPGLWNGSMSNWNTVFIEIPSYLFNPVKTISDLVKE